MNQTSAASSHVADTDHVQRYIDLYIAAWNEPDPDKRRHLLAQVMADDGGYADPAAQLDSPAGIVEYIGDVLSSYPGARIVRTSEVDAHHQFCRFTWRLVQADGKSLENSVDFVEFSAAGKIRRVTGFFGLQTPNAMA